MQYVDKKSKEKEQEQGIREEQFNTAKISAAKRKKKIIGISAVIIIVLIAAISYASFLPGKYDDFAKCLTEKGAVMYGEDWCHYTQGQKQSTTNNIIPEERSFVKQCKANKVLSVL